MDVTRLAPLRSGLYADHATVQVVGLTTSFGWGGWWRRCSSSLVVSS